MKRALISVSNKTGVTEFAKKLKIMEYEIISTGGTAKLLNEKEIAVRSVSDFTGFPEMLDGRVKTLHPKIHGGLLGKRNVPYHVDQMKEQGIEPIDLVAVNLYPFEETISKPGCTLEDAIENIDIGGPAMIRSAAKNYPDVIVIVDPRDYDWVIREMEENNGVLSMKTRYALACKVFGHTARYDSMISSYLSHEGSTPHFPEMLNLQFEKVTELRYGENPHQRGAFYREIHIQEPCVSNAVIHQGKAMSFNNYLDADSALDLVKEFEEPVAVIMKHNNPCGVASSGELREAYILAREADPVSAFGGVVAFNRPVDEETAKEIVSTFVEVVIAPGYNPGVLEIFGTKENIRILEVEIWGMERIHDMDLKKVVGGLIYQDRDLGSVDIRDMEIVSKRRPTEEEIKAMSFAWKVAKHVKSNAIILARTNRTVGIGAGQMSRVDSTRLAIAKAQSPTQGCALASDAFFPFRDGIDEAAKSGATAIVQPGGSIKDNEVIAAANEYDMAMVFTRMRHFRH
ncbi:MAG: bifunctional phosphoribosylaminoimidazolecarboxamide formyltransferase/inosine monophosphate cyclohydrolase [Nitrospirae bacterium CG_4_9_14_3_um_filter_53_35]|nr:MAG: bifunctional phosphoribosylaminoimidazolecarboxamide formyltransferase/inosine monophosphate cyclohydrolase [Nitrospirae bacterium CG17_big_fil_post_rev_8_21_14_2_50_50_9]PIX85678.1 MAG: bifunctional phosphoribosylaminoimidazolecarboxamide formyltransferase/inosine monophosphate cyclohydrolase [Nitrospirae bacterium CG_4_10_14_3_um_filter_53_41]PJA74154.1 MAG: bifunctional phosphoribosylaminoimidazolecarboxamide formyltransferase/inosine monophosphate cyclohydrolase [Nitrospirae bacterium